MTELATFTPAEAARISGVNVALQRDWRRRGLSPREDGSRFNSFAVAELLVMNVLSTRGIGPQQAKLISNHCAAALLALALRDRAAWAGQPDIAPIDRDYLDQLIDAGFSDLSAEYWPARAAALATAAVRNLGYTHDYTDAFVWWANGTHGFYGGLTQAFEIVGRDDPRMQGAIVVLDLGALAHLQLKRSGRALATYDLPDRVRERWARDDAALRQHYDALAAQNAALTADERVRQVTARLGRRPISGGSHAG